MKGMRSWLLTGAALLSAGCASQGAAAGPATGSPRADGGGDVLVHQGAVPAARDEGRSPFVAVPMFFVHLAPDIVSDTLCYFANPVVASAQGREAHSWLLVTLASPVMGPIVGIVDAAEGRPFWKVSAICGRQHERCREQVVVGE